MYGKIFSKFIRYFNLNEISKFSNFDNFFFFSRVKSISIRLNLDSSLEKSKLLYYYKGLLGIFLVYLITNRYPKVKSSKDQRLLCIESSLFSGDLVSFLEKFFIIYDSKKIKHLSGQFKVYKGFIRCLVTDLTIFSELDGFLYFFQPIEFVYIDIVCFHEDDSRNFILLDNLFKSSYLI